MHKVPEIVSLWFALKYFREMLMLSEMTKHAKRTEKHLAYTVATAFRLVLPITSYVCELGFSSVA